jgi:hypothetical protein
VDEAIRNKTDKSFISTETYLAEVELTGRLPNLIPIFGMRVMLSHKGFIVFIVTKEKHCTRRENGLILCPSSKQKSCQFQTK